MNKLLTILLCFYVSTSFAAPYCSKDSAATTSPIFCSSFKSAASCNCTSSGLNKNFCSSMKNIYDLMIGTYSTLKRACESQHITTVQNCIDDWNCYFHGGVNSAGQNCSGSGSICE